MSLLRSFRRHRRSIAVEWLIIGVLVAIAFASGLSAINDDLRPIYIDMSRPSAIP